MDSSNFVVNPSSSTAQQIKPWNTDERKFSAVAVAVCICSFVNGSGGFYDLSLFSSMSSKLEFTRSVVKLSHDHVCMQSQKFANLLQS